MKRNIIYPVLLATSVGIFAGCATQKNVKSVTVEPALSTLTPDSANMAQMQVTFNVPGKYFSKRSRLVISPQLIVEDSVLDEYEPLVLDAPIYSKKKHRKEVLHGYEDPYARQAVKIEKLSETIAIPFNESIEIPDGVDNARIVGVVSNDGCGQCTGIDTIDIANVSVPVSLIDVRKEYNLSWIPIGKLSCDLR